MFSAQHFSTGPGFHHTIAVGDLDGDDVPDVAIPDSQTPAVTVLRGLGDGTLAAYAKWPTFTEPQDVVIADLTGDGLADLATADYTSGGVTLLRGLGSGAFAPRELLAAGSGLIALIAVDLDGDGRRDIATTRDAGSRLVVLPALAGGGFGAAINVATGAGPHQLGSADFDRDSTLDLAVVGTAAGAASIHLGTGSVTPGPATPFACGGAPIGLTVADLDGDGHADLLATNVNAGALTVLRGNGDGTFAAPIAHPTDSRPRGMDTGDLDGDGALDVVIATGYPDGDSLLTVYRGLGGGALERLASVRLPYRAADCVIADMDQDGRLDVVATGPQAGQVTVLRNEKLVLPVPPRGPILGLSLSAHPNPARGAIRFAFEAPGEAPVSLELFDLAGRRVARLGPFAAANGERQVTWRMDAGAGFAPGVHLVRLRAGAHSLLRRVVLLGE